MSAYSKTVLRDLGVMLHVPGLMALASLPVCWWFDEGYAIGPFLVTAVVSLIPGQALYWIFRNAEAMRLRHAMVTVVTAWTLIPLIGLLPFLLIAWRLAGVPDVSDGLLAFQDFWNALFESVSGFTGTGLTLSRTPSELPHALQWWRSFMQWIGGVGVVVLMLSVFHPSVDAHRLYFSEGHGRTSVSGVAEAVERIWWIFPLYTVVAVVLLRATGMDWWQAVNYGMTGIATGGFGITDNSLGDFGPAPRLAMILIMIAGAVSFAAHYRILTAGRFSLLWKDAEYHALFILLVLGSLLLAGENRWYGGSANWFDSVFQWTSALATAGFGTVKLETWSPTAHALISLAMMCGGVAGATTGGLKLNRVVLLAHSIYVRVRGLALHPWRLMEHKPITDDVAEAHRARTVEAAAIMAVLWLIAILAGTMLMLHATEPGVQLNRIVLEVSSALGNVGLTSGITEPDLHWLGKLGLIVLMWAGRLEIVPVLVIVAALIVRPPRNKAG